MDGSGHPSHAIPKNMLFPENGLLTIRSSGEASQGLEIMVSQNYPYAAHLRIYSAEYPICRKHNLVKSPIMVTEQKSQLAEWLNSS